MAIGPLLVSMVMSCWDSCGNCGDQISWTQFTQTPGLKWKSGWLVTGKIHKHPSVSFNSCHPCPQYCRKLAPPTTIDTWHFWHGVVTCISCVARHEKNELVMLEDCELLITSGGIDTWLRSVLNRTIHWWDVLLICNPFTPPLSQARRARVSSRKGSE